MDVRCVVAWSARPNPIGSISKMTLGNRWSVIDTDTGMVLQVLEVEQKNMGVHLPKRKPWWRGILHAA